MVMYVRTGAHNLRCGDVACGAQAAGRQEIAHVGYAHTDAELGILLEKARGIADGDQEAPELEVPRKVTRVD